MPLCCPWPTAGCTGGAGHSDTGSNSTPATGPEGEGKGMGEGMGEGRGDGEGEGRA